MKTNPYRTCLSIFLSCVFLSPFTAQAAEWSGNLTNEKEQSPFGPPKTLIEMSQLDEPDYCGEDYNTDEILYEDDSSEYDGPPPIAFPSVVTMGMNDMSGITRSLMGGSGPLRFLNKYQAMQRAFFNQGYSGLFNVTKRHFNKIQFIQLDGKVRPTTLEEIREKIDLQFQDLKEAGIEKSKPNILTVISIPENGLQGYKQTKEPVMETSMEVCGEIKEVVYDSRHPFTTEEVKVIIQEYTTQMSKLQPGLVLIVPFSVDTGVEYQGENPDHKGKIIGENRGVAITSGLNPQIFEFSKKDTADVDNWDTKKYVVLDSTNFAEEHLVGPQLQEIKDITEKGDGKSVYLGILTCKDAINRISQFPLKPQVVVMVASGAPEIKNMKGIQPGVLYAAHDATQLESKIFNMEIESSSKETRKENSYYKIGELAPQQSRPTIISQIISSLTRFIKSFLSTSSSIHIDGERTLSRGTNLYISEVKDIPPHLPEETIEKIQEKEKDKESKPSLEEKPLIEKERLEQEKLEKERVEIERREKERLEIERREQERLEMERREQERREMERQQQESLERERLDHQRLEK
jgi:hypothetical protein